VLGSPAARAVASQWPTIAVGPASRTWLAWQREAHWQAEPQLAAMLNQAAVARRAVSHGVQVPPGRAGRGMPPSPCPAIPRGLTLLGSSISLLTPKCQMLVPSAPAEKHFRRLALQVEIFRVDFKFQTM
jgi:hypothetical protein